MRPYFLPLLLLPILSACSNAFNSYDIGSINIHASFSNLGFRVAALP